ncbi:sugar ABC transporter ATP-binding protein [Labedaea rhizosphaerae]|uniref:L-arabinose transport system ATP-binding protein n=1 Tax=Labedaea rhizosphaerae TaxID=598644 RepID=A0A4R6SGB9_LABRH|nr:sugar ABC transporter ATP-binding protein [Labedaea rhizosphaerae]TDQ00724.1 L-arabinose transport system ATP-binding protein [Labedaea rhizosphaerae]
MEKNEIPVLSLTGVSKRFAGVRALTDVSLDVRAGEVLALMGENGAGKSTLLRIVNGDHQPDEGHVELDGVPVHHTSPAAAHHAGIRVIAQEPEIIPHVDVAENVFAGALPNRGRLFSRAAARRQARQFIADLGFADVIPVDALGRQLSPAQRQIVEILRGLTGKPRVVAFDEPTSSLSDHEVDILFALIDRLRAEGIAVVYVSHRMKEIFRIADRIAVLRDGALVGVRPAGETSEDELVRMMVGRDLDAMFQRTGHEPGEVVLSLEDVTTDDVSDVSLTVRQGEIVALAGLVGAGRSELAKAIVGDVPIRSGTMVLQGKRIRMKSPTDAVRAGIGFAPEERKAEALILDRGVRDNVSLASLRRLSKLRFVNQRAERALVSRFVDSLRIKAPSMEQHVRKLSGGNQQKVVLARWLAREPALLILDEPTRGVDVGAKAEIYGIINRLAESGTALLIISSELPEVIGLADRIVVMKDGRVSGELPARATEEQILALAMSENEIEEEAS